MSNAKPVYTERQVKEGLAESGKTSKKDMRAIAKYKFPGVDGTLLRMCINEIYDSIHNH